MEKMSQQTNKKLPQILIVILIIMLVGCVQFDRKRYEDIVIQGVEAGTGYSYQFSSIPGEPHIPDGVALDDGISEDEAIALALWNNAAFNETLTDLGFARAEFIKAGLLPNPVLSLLFPVNDRHYESSFTMALDTIWFRPRRLSIAEIQTKNIGQKLVQNGLDLVRDVRLAFTDLALARDLATIGNEQADLQERIAELSGRRLSAGDISELEVMSARIESIVSRSDAAMRQHDIVFASEKLKNLLGLGLENTDFVFDTAVDRFLVVQDIPLLVKEALLARPDYRAAELAVEAAGEKIGLASTDILRISAQIDGDEISNSFQFGPGFKVELPVFNRNQDGKALAHAEFEKSLRQVITIRDRIVLEVKQAYTRYAQAQENLGFLRLQILPGIREVARQAEKAYESGNIMFLMVLETTNRLLAAREQEVKSNAALQRALADLERNVGRRLDRDLKAKQQ